MSGTNAVDITNGSDLSFTTLNITVPTVTTANVTDISSDIATGGGDVTDDGGATVTECGICWSTSADPTTGDTCASLTGSEAGTGVFSKTMADLESTTTYHVRAYATNSAGTVYGNDVTFVTGRYPWHLFQPSFTGKGQE